MADRYILAVESSCDETSVAVLKNEKELLSNIIASQVESHKRFGGVVPEERSWSGWQRLRPSLGHMDCL